jgi:hypothetical protein
MAKLDRETQKLIADAIEAGIKKGMEKALGMYGEVWLTTDEVVKQFGMISEDFLKRKGKLLPRERVEYMGEDGLVHTGKWAYPRNRMQEMIASGELRCLYEK